MIRSYRTFCAVFALVFALLLWGTAAFSVLTDGNDVFASVSLESLAPYREHKSRTAKAARVARGDAELLLIGTSRTEVGLDPADPAWGEGVAYNAGLGGGNVYETLKLVELALASGRPRTLVFGVDLYGMRSDLRGSRGFDRSLLSPELEPLDYWAGNVIGRYGVESGWNALRKAREGRVEGSRIDGLRIPREASTALDQRERFAGVLKSYYVGVYNPAYEYDPGLVERLGEVLSQARRQGVEVIVHISPVHALQAELMLRSGLGETFERLRRDLVGKVEEVNRLDAAGPAVALWDFVGWSGKLVEPLPAEGARGHMTWFVESSHCSVALGHELAKRVRGRPDADPSFGARLDALSLEEHLARQRADRKVYAATRAADLRWLEDLLSEQQATREDAGAREMALKASSGR